MCVGPGDTRTLIQRLKEWARRQPEDLLEGLCSGQAIVVNAYEFSRAKAKYEELGHYLKTAETRYAVYDTAQHSAETPCALRKEGIGVVAEHFGDAPTAAKAVRDAARKTRRKNSRNPRPQAEGDCGDGTPDDREGSGSGSDGD